MILFLSTWNKYFYIILWIYLTLFNIYVFFCLFLAPPDFKPKNLKLIQTSSDCVRLDWENPYTDVEANYQVWVYVIVLILACLVSDYITYWILYSCVCGSWLWIIICIINLSLFVIICMIELVLSATTTTNIFLKYFCHKLVLLKILSWWNCWCKNYKINWNVAFNFQFSCGTSFWRSSGSNTNGTVCGLTPAVGLQCSVRVDDVIQTEVHECLGKLFMLCYFSCYLV